MDGFPFDNFKVIVYISRMHHKDTTKAPKKVRLSVTIPRRHRLELARIGDMLDMPIAALIRWAIDDWIGKKQDRKRA